MGIILHYKALCVLGGRNQSPAYFFTSALFLTFFFLKLRRYLLLLFQRREGLMGILRPGLLRHINTSLLLAALLFFLRNT